jgi:hypothetical protein
MLMVIIVTNYKNRQTDPVGTVQTAEKLKSQCATTNDYYRIRNRRNYIQ